MWQNIRFVCQSNFDVAVNTYVENIPIAEIQSKWNSTYNRNILQLYSTVNRIQSHCNLLRCEDRPT